MTANERICGVVICPPAQSQRRGHEDGRLVKEILPVREPNFV
jgi:hypothetical protein